MRFIVTHKFADIFTSAIQANTIKPLSDSGQLREFRRRPFKMSMNENVKKLL